MDVVWILIGFVVDLEWVLGLIVCGLLLDLAWFFDGFRLDFQWISSCVSVILEWVFNGLLLVFLDFDLFSVEGFVLDVGWMFVGF